MKTLVLGASVSGEGATRLALRLGHRVAVYDRDPGAAAAISSLGVDVFTGEWSAALLVGIDLVVTSPGFAEGSAPIEDVLLAGIKLQSELETAVAQLDVPYAAVTGTNGKTTVTRAAADMLARSGLRAVAAGNIGTALSDVVGGPWDAVCIEASSFQLRFTETFHPGVAVVLNVASDHLDWHGSQQAYTEAKARIFALQTREDVLIFDADDPGATALVSNAKARLVPVSGRRIPGEGHGVESGRLVVGAVDVLTPPELGPAFLVDLVAAATIATELGASAEGVAATIASFSPQGHRRQPIGTWSGVTWVNDSKATNPHAAVAAMNAFPTVVLIAGGRNKGLDLNPMGGPRSLKHAVVHGEAAIELAEIIGADRTTVVGHIGEAVAVADRLSASGDTVLLAPGCASFDEFVSYADRGETFTRLVLELKQAGVGN